MVSGSVASEHGKAHVISRIGCLPVDRGSERLMTRMSTGHDGESGTRRADPIAIVGISCRLPGAKSPSEFFSSLRSGTDRIARISADRLGAMPDHDPEAFPAAGLPGGFLDSVDTFDADFFGAA